MYGLRLVFALTIRQPWAWLVVNGHKDVENRPWRTSHRGPLAIHAASRAMDDDADVRAWVLDRFGIEIPAELPRSSVVGVANVIDVVTASSSPWFFGPFGFVLRDARPCEPLHASGRLGLFRLPPVIHRRLASNTTGRARPRSARAPGRRT